MAVAVAAAAAAAAAVFDPAVCALRLFHARYDASPRVSHMEQHLWRFPGTWLRFYEYV